MYVYLQIGQNGCAMHPAMPLAAGVEESVMSKIQRISHCTINPTLLSPPTPPPILATMIASVTVHT